jgi:hypothetical protein
MTVTIDQFGWAKEATGIYWGPDSFGPFVPGVPLWIVLHGTAWPGGTATIIGNEWAAVTNAGRVGAATHAIIDKDGSWVQGITFKDTAAGNSGAFDSPRAAYLPQGNLNLCTVSIEHCKYDASFNSDILTSAQQTTSFELVNALCEFLSIPKKVVTIEDVSQGGIIRHYDCDQKNRPYCPGPYPFQQLQDYLNGGTPMFTNAACVDVWNSTGMGSDDATRTTGLFSYWRDQWANHKNFLGAPSTHEYPYTLIDGTKSVARNFGSNTVVWNNGNPYQIRG